ncbi:hypothetical protein V2G26_007211 [Clonostachys chloroleuca]
MALKKRRLQRHRRGGKAPSSLVHGTVEPAIEQQMPVDMDDSSQNHPGVPGAENLNPEMSPCTAVAGSGEKQDANGNGWHGQETPRLTDVKNPKSHGVDNDGSQDKVNHLGLYISCDQEDQTKSQTGPQDIGSIGQKDSNMQGLDYEQNPLRENTESDDETTHQLTLDYDHQQLESTEEASALKPEEDPFLCINGDEMMDGEIYLLKYLENGERFWVPEKTLQSRYNAAVCTYWGCGPGSWKRKELEGRDQNLEARILSELEVKPNGDRRVQILGYPISRAIILPKKKKATYPDAPPIKLPSRQGQTGKERLETIVGDKEENGKRLFSCQWDNGTESWEELHDVPDYTALNTYLASDENLCRRCNPGLAALIFDRKVVW